MLKISTNTPKYRNIPTFALYEIDLALILYHHIKQKSTVKKKFKRNHHLPAKKGLTPSLV